MENKYELYKGDCLEVMNILIEKGIEIDLILTDPPYGTIKGAKLGWKNNENNWDNIINTESIFDKSEKLLRENGIMAIFSQEPYTSKLRTTKINSIEFSYPLIWKKDHFANALISKKAPVNYFEDINIFYKKYDTEFKNELRNYSKKVFEYININYNSINKILGHRKSEHFFYYNSNQFKIPSEKTYNELIEYFFIDKMEGFLKYEQIVNINNKYKKIFNLNGEKKKSNILEYKKDYEGFHPTQKPVKLLEDIIKTYTNEGDIVLDFTMGSGSTGVACMNTNRRFIGIELDENYFNIAKKRIEEV